MIMQTSRNSWILRKTRNESDLAPFENNCTRELLQFERVFDDSFFFFFFLSYDMRDYEFLTEEYSMRVN